MRKLRWQLVIIVVTGLVVGILLLAQQPAAQTTQTAPTQGGVYTEGLVGSLVRLNPLLDLHNPVDRDIDRLVYSGLVRFDSRGVAQPDLAETWAYTPDGTVYNISLKPGIKWQDGKPLTTDDIIFTIEQMSGDSSTLPDDQKAFWKDVQVKKMSDTLIQFRLPEPFAPFMDYLTFGVLPKHLFEGKSFQEIVDSPINLQPVGSGPYRFDHALVENNQIAGVVLHAYDDYYGKKPFIEQIVFRFYPDAQSAFVAYKDGQLQGISQVTSDLIAKALAEPDLAMYTGRLPQTSLVLFNLNNTDVPFFQDVNIRKALFTGLNRQRMVDQILKGQAIIADGPILPGTWAYYNGLERVTYNQDAALNMLKAAGYTLKNQGDTVRSKDDRKLSFELLYPDDALHTSLAEAIQADWAKLGVEAKIQPLSYETLVNERLNGRLFQAALVDLNLERSPDPDPYPFWDQAQATGGQNYTQWNNTPASEALEQARVTVKMDERSRLYHNFQVIFNKELPALPLYYPVYNYAVDRTVQGVQMGPLFSADDRFATISDWFLVARRPLETTTPTPTSKP